MNDQQMMTAVGLVLQHGSIEVAARAGGIPVLQMGKLVEKAIAAGYLAKTDASERSRSRVCHVSDIHAPYHHADALSFVLEIIGAHKCDEVVFAGDELDQHSLSAHPVDPNGSSPGDELELGLNEMRRWYKAIPDAKLCVSNHGARPYRKAFLSGLPSQYLKSFSDFMQAPPGWVWADQFEIDSVVYSHGESASGPNGALQLAIRQAKSQACGHWHGSAGASYFHNGEKTVFGLYSGCLIDADALGFRYGKHSKNKPIIGSSVVLEGQPMFIAMPMDKHGRWTGKLK